MAVFSGRSSQTLSRRGGTMFGGAGAAVEEMDDWWGGIDREILKALEGGPMAPADVGVRLGMSERAAASLLWTLASQGKIRIRVVELVTASPS